MVKKIINANMVLLCSLVLVACFDDKKQTSDTDYNPEPQKVTSNAQAEDNPVAQPATEAVEVVSNKVAPKKKVSSNDMYTSLSYELAEMELNEQTYLTEGADLTLDDIKIMREMGVRVAFGNEKKGHPIPDNISINELKQATILDFGGKSLYQIPTWLRNFNNLKKLDLSNAHVPFADIANFPNMNNIEILILHNNDLFKTQSVDANDAEQWLIFLNKIQNVKVLDLSFKPLTLKETSEKRYVPANLHFLANLIKLDLSGNHIGDDIQDIGLQKMNGLQTLDVSNTQISNANIMQYLPLSDLVKLNLGYNKLAKINYYQAISSLKELNLEGNAGLQLADEYAGAFISRDLLLLTYDDNAKIPAELQQRLWLKNLQKTGGKQAVKLAKKGIYKDKKTGLQWMRCSLGQKWNGKNCTGEAAEYEWKEAFQAIKALNKTGYAGYSDWRLPNIAELHTLIYCSTGFKRTYKIPTSDGKKTLQGECKDGHKVPTIDTMAFPNTEAFWYWSSSPYANLSYNAWIVNFGNGNAGYNYKDNTNHVRAVRVSQ